MTEAASEVAEAVKAARIISPKERSATVPLDWPVEWDGVLYESVTVRRLTGAEVEAYVKAVADSKDGQAPKMPAIDCPDEVYNALDDDDRLRVEEALGPFLPRRFKEAVESIFGATENTSAS